MKEVLGAARPQKSGGGDGLGQGNGSESAARLLGHQNEFEESGAGSAESFRHTDVEQANVRHPRPE